ncbi:hypothetical protein LL946_06075 [Knoellia locipacati]|uniref:hypothetical protein n=1 Tax=Knoellia locipacati TaxID=882824 RepID=UPI00384AD469
MTMDEIDDFATSLVGCKRKGHPGGAPGTSTTGSSCARSSGGTVVIRVRFEDRERLLEANTETFGVPSRFESHMKVQANLDGDPDTIKMAIRRAWEFQRRH